MSMRARLSIPSLVAAGLLLAGCTSAPAAAPDPIETEPSPTASAPAEADAAEFAATWVDEGRMIAVVSWGSSSCVPTAGDVSLGDAQGSIELLPAQKEACTKDLAPRATLIPVTGELDPTTDTRLDISLDGVSGVVDLPGNAALSPRADGELSDFAPSAGRFDDTGIVLVTWGSSSCPPIVSGVEEAEGSATVTFAEIDGICTEDLAPRATVLSLANASAELSLTLVGGGQDATLAVRG